MIIFIIIVWISIERRPIASARPGYRRVTRLIDRNFSKMSFAVALRDRFHLQTERLGHKSRLENNN